MNEQTNPAAGVSQGDGTIESAVARLVQSEDHAPEAEQKQPTPDLPQEEPAEQPQGQAEPTADDLPVEEEPQPSVDEFEIVHGGQQHKLPRAEVIRLAQQGFDYTQKTQALAEHQRALAQRLQALAEVEQVQPQLLNTLATVQSLRTQLAQYQNVDWIRIANDDPIAYSQQRARYDVLMDSLNRAEYEHRSVSEQVKQRTAQIQQHMLAQEISVLPNLVPEWKDGTRRSSDEAQIEKHYAEVYGVHPDDLRASLNGKALSLAVAYKAMKYDQLLKSKTEKSKQLRTLPPVTVPGAKTGSAKADQEAQLKSRLRKTGSIDDAAALLLNRSK